MLPLGPGAVANHTKAQVETGCAVPAATSPATLHDPVQAEPSSPGRAARNGQRVWLALDPERMVLRMLSMVDPLGDTHILISVQNGCQRDLFTMFFCSSLSRTEREEYDGKTPPADLEPAQPHLTSPPVHSKLSPTSPRHY